MEPLKSTRFSIADERDVSLAAIQSRLLLEQRGLDTAEASAIATAISELAHNIVIHSDGPGEIVIRTLADEAGNHTIFMVDARDPGPGIANPQQVLEGNFSGKGLGLGLIGVQELMDSLEFRRDEQDHFIVTACKRLDRRGSKHWRIELCNLRLDSANELSWIRGRLLTLCLETGIQEMESGLCIAQISDHIRELATTTPWNIRMRVLLDPQNRKLHFELHSPDRSRIFHHSWQIPPLQISHEWIERQRQQLAQRSAQQLLHELQQQRDKLEENTRSLSRIALYDSLTGLVNRAHFIKRLEEQCNKGSRNRNPFALLYIDLDGFKQINDLLGHQAGDQVLRKLSARMATAVRSGDLLGRLGGDEFVVITHDSDGGAGAANLANRLLSALRPPLLIDSRKLTLSASIGIALFPGDGEAATTILQHADMAMYHAKYLGGDRFQFYNHDMDQAISHRIELAQILKHAIREHRFNLVYQAIVDSRGMPVIMEALVRLKSGEAGPAEFIPIIEQSGDIVELGRWIIDQAIAQCSRWRKNGQKDLRIAINISPRQIHSAGFVRYLQDTLTTHRLPAEAVILEVTEHLLLESNANTDHILSQLRTLGFGLAIDDFGTGYSSLSYLLQSHFNLLKIDQSFVARAIQDPRAATIVEGVVYITRKLDQELIAEGVENVQTLQLLEKLECPLRQGYLFARPMDAESCTDWLAKQGMRVNVSGNTNLSLIK